MGLPFGIWLIFIGLLWGAEGDQGDSVQFGNTQSHAIGTARSPPINDDDILRINQGLIPPEAPESSFLMEGDIIKVNPSRVFSSASPKWPKRRGTVQIPYVISYKYDKWSVKIIKEAFADFAKFTCIKFVPYSYQRDFISIIPMAGCFSSVGRTGGMQVVSLAPACFKKGKGVALHELMHVVGFWHEHSRADRDKYISISWSEILPGFEINFMKSWTSNMLVNYDYSSVLHYGRYAFSMTGLPTITPLSDPYAALGQRWNLSRLDIARVNKLYKCSLTGAGAGSPTESTTKRNITDSISNKLKPCSTEGETSPTVKASPLATNTPETVQTAWGPSTQVMSALTAGTEKLLSRTAMHDGLSGPLTAVQGVESVKFAPTGLSTHGMTYVEASRKTPATYMEMSTVEAKGKLIPVEETSLLGTVSIQESPFTTVMASSERQTSPRGVMLHQGRLEGLGTTKVPSETLAGLEFPEWVSSTRVAPLATVGTRAREVGIPKTTDIQGMELAYQSTSLVQSGPSSATEVGMAMTPNQTWPLETQTEVSTAEITSSSEESSEMSMPVAHTAGTQALGQTLLVQVRNTETSHPASTEKWTTNLPRLMSAKSVTTMTPTSSAPTGRIPSVEMEATTMAYATEQTSLLSIIQSWTSSSINQRSQAVAHEGYSPGSREQSTIAASSIKEREPTEVKQPTLLTSFDMAENHTTDLTETGVQGATRRHNKSTALFLSGIETSYIEPPTKATTFMETYSELGFVEDTRIKASSEHGFLRLTGKTPFSVSKGKDAEYTTESETLPLTGVSQTSEPSEMGMQITANYRNKERVHTSTFPVGGPSPIAFGLMYTVPSLAPQNPQNEGLAETIRSEDRSQATMPSNRKGHIYTPASLISSTATELKFMEHPTSEASGLETAVAQASSLGEMRIARVSSAWTEAKDQFSSTTRETALFPVSSSTGKGNSTKVIQSPESPGLPELGTNEHTVRAGLVTLMPPESRPQTLWMQPMEIPKLTVPGKQNPVHTESTTNQVQTGVKNISLALGGKMPSLQTKSSKAIYPSEGSSLLQASPQTFSPIDLRLKMSKQQMHVAITSRDNLTPSKGTSIASLSADELQHSVKDASTWASEIPTLQSEEAKGRGITFPFGTTVEKTYMKPSEIPMAKSQTTSTPELQTPEASSAHALRASFPKVLLSEAMTAPLMGRSERNSTHSILTWEPIAQVGPKKQTVAWFPKTSPLSSEHVKGTDLEAPAVSRHMENLGIEAKKHGSVIERSSSASSQAQEVTFPTETLTTSSGEMSVWEARNPPRQRSRWVSHPAHSIEGISLAGTEPTYGKAFVGPQHSTVSPSYPDTAKAMGTEAGNQLSLSISSSRTEMGAQELKGEPRKEGRQSLTPPSGGQRESLKVKPSLKTQAALLQTSWSKKGLFPFRQTQPFWGVKSTKPATGMEFPHLSENWQLSQAQTSTNVPALPSLRTPGPPPLTPASSKPKRVGSYREKEVTNLQGTSVAKTVPEAVHSTRMALLLGVPENTLGPREVAMKEETSGHREEEDLATTNLLLSVTLSTETAKQLQFTQIDEMRVPENWPSGHPGLGTGKHPTNKTQTERTSLISLGELPSLVAQPTIPVFPAEGTSLLQASPHQTFSPSKEQMKTTASQETHAILLPWEEHGQSLMSFKGLQPMETSEQLAGLFTQTTSMGSSETLTLGLQEVNASHEKQGHGKPSSLPTDIMLPAKNETRILSSTKTALGMEALEDQTASQTELGITEVSLAQLAGSSIHAERTSFPGAEATEFLNEVPKGGTGTQIMFPNDTREQILTARTQSMGNKATEQSHSTIGVSTMKASETSSSPGKKMLYTATSGHGKTNVEQANTHLSGSTSSSGSDTTHPSRSLWPPHYQTARVSTEPLKYLAESGSQSAVEIPAEEVEPMSFGSSLETQTTSSLAEGNEGKFNLSAYGDATPVGHWGQRHETHVPEWHSRTVNTTKLANDDTAWSQGERTVIKSAVGGMQPPDTKEAHGVKANQMKQAFQKRSSSLFTVDPEILHLVGKRSLPDEVEIPAPPHDSKPDLKVITPSHRQSGPELHSPLLLNTLEKQKAKVLRGYQKQLVLVPRLQVSSVTTLYPAAGGFKCAPWWLVLGTSVCAPGCRCGIFRLKELLFLGRKKATSQAPVLTSAKAVRATATPGMDKPSATLLPRQHSDPGKQGHSIQTPGAPLEYRIPEWQLCDFEKDLCGWQHSEMDDFDWMLAGERPAQSLPSDSISGPHDSPSGGNYISLRSPSTQQTPGQKTALMSPVLHGIGCIYFWYSPLGSVMGTINLYIKFADAPEWHRIWTAKRQQGTEWHQVGVEASESQKLQVIVEGVIGPEAGSDAGVDDLSVCVAECQESCKELIALYKKQDVQQTK